MKWRRTNRWLALKAPILQNQRAWLEKFRKNSTQKRLTAFIHRGKQSHDQFPQAQLSAILWTTPNAKGNTDHEI
jgi:hypothetical protein